MATLSSVIKPRPDLSGNGSNISIADGKQAEWPRPTYARSSAGPTTLSPWISCRNCSVELVLMNERLRKRGEEGKDYTLHLLLLLFHHPVARAIGRKQRRYKRDCHEKSSWKKD